MKNFFVTGLFGMLFVATGFVVTGCGTSNSTPTKKTKRPPKKTVPAKVVKKVTPVIPLDQRRYGGLPHTEWPQRLTEFDPKKTDLNSAEAGIAIDGMVALVRDRDVPVLTRKLAATMLGRIGQLAAEKSVPAFRELLKKNREAKPMPRTRPLMSSPQAVLISIGQWVKIRNWYAVESRRWDICLWSIRALRLLGPNAKLAFPELKMLLRDSKQPVAIRRGIVELLGSISSSDVKVVNELMALLSVHFGMSISRADADLLRGDVIDAVRKIGPSASPAIPKLRALANSENNETIRCKSLAAIGVMKNEQVIPFLKAVMLDDDHEAVREAAMLALVAIGPASISAFQKLLESRFRAEDIVTTEQCERAVRGIGLLSPLPKSAKDAIEETLDDEDEWVSFHAAVAYWRITKKFRDPFSALIETIQSKDRQLRIATSNLLVEMGLENSAAIIKNLEGLLKKETLPSESRTAIRKTIENIQASIKPKNDNPK